MGPRLLVRACVAAVLAVPLAACGEDSGDSSDATAKETSAALGSPTAGRWLVRLTGISTERDDESQRARYAWVTPDTGEVAVIEGETFSESAAGRETTLLVDAGRRWAVSASMVQANDTPPRVIDLESGDTTPLEVDLAGLRAWSFDPERADRLRVVQESGQISLVDLSATPPTVTPEDTLEMRGGEYGYYFDAETGHPYVVALRGDAVRPGGLGDEPGTPVEVDGGQLLFNHDALPARPCALNAAFRRSDGAETAFCVNGRRLTVFARGGADEPFLPVGQPIRLGFFADGVDFAMPPAS